VDDAQTPLLPLQLRLYQEYFVGPPRRQTPPVDDLSPPPRQQGLDPAIDLSITRHQLRNFRLNGNHAFVKETVFVIPKNDGEAMRAIEILKAIKAPKLAGMYIEWGGKLDAFYHHTEYFLDTLRTKYGIPLREIKRIVLFELPAPKLEEGLRRAGYEVVIIDHHNYAELEDKRYRAESSLEQLMSLIGWEPSRADMAIAINDRGYIPELREFGLNDDEIREVRLNDHLGQGKTISQVLGDRQRAEEILSFLPRVNGFYVLESLNREVDSALVKEELNIREHGVVNIFEFSGKRIGFSGSPTVIKALEAIDYKALGYRKEDVVVYGGGSQAASMFFGFKPKNPPRGSGDLFPFYVKAHFLEVAKRALVDPTNDWGF
jgi:hypothetical protein